MKTLNSTIIFFLLFFISVEGLNGKLLPLYPGEEDYLAFAEVMPEPANGLESIYKLIKYPETAKKIGVQGKVYLLIFIDEKGDVDNVKVIKGIGGGCDEAAADAIKKIKFKPGENAGKTVKVKLSLPITFKIK